VEFGARQCPPANFQRFLRDVDPRRQGSARCGGREPAASAARNVKYMLAIPGSEFFRKPETDGR